MADRAAGAARATALEPGLVARVAGALRYAVTGKAPDWFGPSQAIAPALAAEQAAAAGVSGRAFDYATGYNLQSTPRRDEGITFAQLRGLADAHDLTRLAIETRKDQMERLAWGIRRRDGAEGDPPAALVDFFRRPDREHTWRAWLRQVLEEMLVTDACALYRRRTRGGQLYALEQVDGATVLRLLDARGRTPAAPDPAYQQVLKGVPAVEYTRDELCYAPRNPRVHKVYGYSPVEQIIVTVNLALRRQRYQLAAFTEGTVPDAFANVPTGWTPDQIKQMQAYWDMLMEGPEALAQRRKLKFLPGDTKITKVQDAPLFDGADEWLARVVSYAFSLPPNAFVKQQNRATAESAQDVAQSEGLAPLMGWVKELCDGEIQEPTGLGMAEWEFFWEVEREPDPEVQMRIDVGYAGARIRTRKDIALERFGTFDESLAADPTPVAPGGAVPNGKPGGGSAQDDPDDAEYDGDDEAAKAAGRSLRRWRY